MKKNLILGTVVKLTKHRITPFVTSLRKTSFNGDLVLYVSLVKQDVIDFLKQNNVTVREFNYLEAHRLMPLHAFRYFLYDKFLKQNAEKYDAVFFTDTKDVVFQQDPFAFNLDHRLHVFLEERTRKIGKCQFNANWIAEKFGRNELQKLAPRTICCSGTSFARTPAATAYLAKMTEYLVPPVHTVGYDQGVHNYLLYNQLLDQPKVVENNTGPVLTMGGMDPAQVIFDNNNRVVNQAGLLVNVLHQYDRHEQIKNRLTYLWQ